MSVFQRTIYLLALLVFSASVIAKPPNQQVPAAVVPIVHSVIVDYGQSKVLVKGENLDPASVGATLGGVDISSDLAPVSATLLEIPFSATVSSIVANPGTYVLTITTSGGNVTLSAFIPFALIYIPPSNDPCPCQAEWDYFRNKAPPDGFAGLAPYCYQNNTDFVTVQFWDTNSLNYWVLMTDWDGTTGSCALAIDGPTRTINETEFNACAGFLRQTYIEVYSDTGYTCLY
ncbi:MAG: hypothetical protein ACU836_02835 [Gammaproteobacteria bacterium]